MDPPKDIKREAAATLNEVRPADPAPSKKPACLKRLLSLAITIVTITVCGAYAFIAAPDGKITSPSAGSQTGRVVEIEGYTKNIPHDIRNIWLVVEVESLGLCWQKRPIYKPNSLFKTTIHINGPNKEYTVSLFAVDPVCHADILTWFEIAPNSQTESGLEMLTGCFKLDSVKLALKKP